MIAGSVAVLGGGVMGLSAAYALLRRGRRVTVLDWAGGGPQASWAGAGILAAASAEHSTHPLDRLCGLSNEIHAQWARDLLAETGIDNEYHRCGGFYLASTLGECAALAGRVAEWVAEGIEVIPLAADECRSALGPDFDPLRRVQRAALLPDERQLRNPRHLRALREAVARRGGEWRSLPHPPEIVAAQRTLSIRLPDGHRLSAEFVCVCAGAWSQSALAPCGIHLPMTPVRGQMLLYQLDQPPFRSIINEGTRYLVPRQDGLVLVGSTVEEVGFDHRTTAEGIEALQQFASALHRALSPHQMIRSWAGLRPASFDGLPYLGRLPGTANGLIATAHFRSGLQLSAVAAEILADLVEDQLPPIDLQLFSPARTGAIAPALAAGDGSKEPIEKTGRS